jgi:hypothetical protein
MKRLIAMLAFAVVACGGPQHKKEGSTVEGADVPATCCCKTIPQTAEKEIIPVYAMEGRMECSTKQGECVDDVQCNASTHKEPGEAGGTGPSSSPLPPSTSSSGAEPAIPR